ncbi:MAG: aconitate hydratase AcnA [Alphaproteobacteria bacterium]|nr:aconitate hydratase AcnA [Alphaproteobacteria bacterium]
MPIQTGTDSLKTRQTLAVGDKTYSYYSLREAEKTLGSLARLPFSLKVLLENLLRYEDGRSVTVDDVKAIGEWLKTFRSDHEVAYRPARVLMQDFTGVPAVADLAAMRDATIAAGGDPKRVNPLCPVDLVIDHSVMIDFFGAADAFGKNVDMEFKRNGERYEFLKWAQKSFDNFRVVPPGTGICHQVNLEYLAQTVWTDKDQSGNIVAYPDTCVGTDSHTTMINGLAVLGWGVGGIEAEAAMLGQPVTMLIPEVVGFKLTGKLPEGATATDLVLTVTQMLRKKGVVGKFVEFYGPGLDGMALADRATIANMAPEYGATCGLFPIDAETINYLKFTGRDPERAALVEAYAKAQGMWRDASSPDPVFTDALSLDLSTVVPSLAGPRLPQGRVALGSVAVEFEKELMGNFKVTADARGKAVPVAGMNEQLRHGDVVIAAITSCTNTSNPSVLIAAGLVARKAREKGLKVKPWVKTSLAPGSQVVTDYLAKSGLQTDLDALGFNIVGYGCTTCIGNSGPLPEPVANAVVAGDLVAAAVLSGNRNFEGRVNPNCKANYLASPPLVVAYALAGSMTIDMTTQPLGKDSSGANVYLKDIWPTNREIQDTLAAALTPDMFRSRYANVFAGTDAWQHIKIAEGVAYKWNASSTYVKLPPLFENMPAPGDVHDVRGARLLALLGDNITTDHISPAGDIKKSSPAGKYLLDHGVDAVDFNSYGARRGNHEVMMRGTFANIRIKNELMGGAEGGNTKYFAGTDAAAGVDMPIYDAAMKYMAEGKQLVVVAGKEYGTGSSRDWAAKGTKLLGVRAVIAESFERIHRSNLVGMGVLPLEFKGGMTRRDLNLTGVESFDITGVESGLKPRMDLTLTITRADGSKQTAALLCRIDTLDEVDYFRNDGILPYVLRSLIK